MPLPAPRIVETPPAYEPVRRKKFSVLYLEPDQFPEAPLELRQALTERGCRIPQTYDGEIAAFGNEPEFEQGNLAPGYFKSTAELHWAVLCSRDRKTSLLVFDSLGRLDEKLEGPAEDYEEGFPGYIEAADRQHILRDRSSFGGDDTPEPPPIFHEGVESGISGKGSEIYYWHQCRWISLQGAD